MFKKKSSKAFFCWRTAQPNLELVFCYLTLHIFYGFMNYIYSASVKSKSCHKSYSFMSIAWYLYCRHYTAFVDTRRCRSVNAPFDSKSDMLLPKNERGFSFPIIRTDHAFITVFWWAMYKFFYQAELDDSVGLAKSPASHESSISNGEAAVGNETGWPRSRQMEEAASCHVVAVTHV